MCSNFIFKVPRHLGKEMFHFILGPWKTHMGSSEFTAVSPKVSRYSAVFISPTEELKRNKAGLKSDLIWVRCGAVLELLWGLSSINRK